MEERISDGAAVISPTSVATNGSFGGGSGLSLPGSGSSSLALGALLNTSPSSSTSSLVLPWNGHNMNANNHHNTIGTPTSEPTTLVGITATTSSVNATVSGSSPGSGKAGMGNKYGHNNRGESCTSTGGEHHDNTCLQANLGDVSTGLRLRGSKAPQLVANGLTSSGSAQHGGNGHPIANGLASQSSTIGTGYFGEVDYMEKMKDEAGGSIDHQSLKSSSGLNILQVTNNVTPGTSSTVSSVGSSSKSNKASGNTGSGSAPRDTSRKNRGGDGSSGGKQSSAKEVDLTAKMEADLKKLKIDLQISKNKENDLRDQIISFMSSKLNVL